MRLNCVINNPSRFSEAFSLEIDGSDSVEVLKGKIIEKNPRQLGGIDPSELILWKIDLSFKDLQRSAGNTETISKLRLSPLDEIYEYFPEEPQRKHIHVLVELPQVVVSSGPLTEPLFSVPKNLKKARLYEVDSPLSVSSSVKSINDRFFVGDPGIFLNNYLTSNHSFPTYHRPATVNDFSLGMKPESNIPMLRPQIPSLLLHSLPETIDSLDRLTHLDEIFQSMELALDTWNMMVLLGPSGCGKTRTCYELLSTNWGFFFVVERQDNFGSGDFATLVELISARVTKEDYETNRAIAEHWMYSAILSRILILRYCLFKDPNFTPRKWLLLQIAPVYFAHLSGYRQDIFCDLMSQLAVCDTYSIQLAITTEYSKLREFTKNFPIFPVIIDEAQELDCHLNGYFRSSQDPKQKRTLLSPVAHVLNSLHRLHRDLCVILSGTGLSLIKLEPKFRSGCLKPGGLVSFVNFGGWESADQVHSYASRFLDISKEQSSHLFDLCRGRYRPLVTCIEYMVRGYSYIDAIDELIAIVIAKEEQPVSARLSARYSFYSTLVRIEDRGGGWQLLNQIHEAVLNYVYTGQPRYFIEKDLKLVEKGLCRMRYLSPFRPARLERVKSGDPSIDNILQQEQEIIPVKAESHVISNLYSGFAAFIDEPLVVLAAIYFFRDRHKMIDSVFQTMTIFKSDPAMIGKLWERCIPEEMERIFDGTRKLSQLALFQGIEGLNMPLFYESAIVVTPTRPRFTNVKLLLSTPEYNLGNYLQDDASTRPPFFAPDNLAGPDLVFFVKIQGASGEIHIPVLVQVKLRNYVESISLRTTDPNLLYRNRDGNLINRERTAPLLTILKQHCQHGVIRILVAYPAKFPGSPMIINSHNYDLRGNESCIWPQLIGIIDSRNITELFSERHVSYLNFLKEINGS
ncbi:uncharacterized protein VTP21DRAFT_5297 [Calcarisporiella thermophila]|uniref:uncharacterized protein n=1 Tax=Calcarisporiella thermophila TaxID=911321 RepID=UPI00374342EB